MNVINPQPSKFSPGQDLESAVTRVLLDLKLDPSLIEHWRSGSNGETYILSLKINGRKIPVSIDYRMLCMAAYPSQMIKLAIQETMLLPRT